MTFLKYYPPVIIYDWSLLLIWQHMEEQSDNFLHVSLRFVWIWLKVPAIGTDIAETISTRIRWTE